MTDIQYLSFEQLQTQIDVSFWLKFTSKKLDEWKLEAPPQNLRAYISMPMNTTVAASLVLDGDSFINDTGAQEKQMTTGGIIDFALSGKFLHFNTIEEYNAFDFKELADSKELQEKCALPDLSSLIHQSYFVMACFGDLKNYDYHYKIGFVQGTEKFQTLKGKKLSKQIDQATQQVFKEQINLNLGKTAGNFYPQAFLISSDPAQAQKTKDALNGSNCYLCFLDNTPKLPSILLNNQIHKYLKQFMSSPGCLAPNDQGQHILKMIFVKDRITRQQISKDKGDDGEQIVDKEAQQKPISLDSSFYCEIVLHTVPNFAGCENKEEKKIVKFTENQAKKVNLKAQLDTKDIVENAADLNLKLMKWRQIESLDLDVLQKTSCLMLGSGSLGCQVARNLVSWGYRKITFVDAGKVSYSNPVRQCLFTYEDSIQADNFKAPIAAKRLLEVFPMVTTRGEVLKIPMPGHAVGQNEAAISEMLENAKKLEELVKEHDVIFLLTDSRESRWLPTVLSGIHNKICLTIALGFETYLAMRHGLSAKVHDPAINGERLGCYFCNDVVAPRNSLRDRSLDQQCTVSRPALCCMASALGVELLTSLLNHPLKHGAKAKEEASQCDKSPLGILPQQLRGDLSTFSMNVMYGECFDKCIGCSAKIAEAYEADWQTFLIKACNMPDYLEDETGITEMNNAINLDDIEAFDDFDFD